MTRVLKYSAYSSLILGVFAILLALAVWLLPKPSLYDPTRSQSRAFYSSGGELLRLTTAGDQRYRLRSNFEDLPPSLIQATLRYEDQYFYQHWGVNPAAIWRAFYSTYIAGTRRVGASTLTMQLARMRFGIHSRSVLGKLEQMFRAIQLEWHYNKLQILAAYFNHAPYGGNIESVSAASIIYFDKPVTRLTQAEALALAVIPQNPSKRFPESQSGLQAIEAARLRLGKMLQEEATGWSLSKDLTPSFRARAQLPFTAPHHVDQLAASNREQQVVSTLEFDKQALLEKVSRRYLKSQKHLALHNIAALLVDARSMNVLAQQGSADYFSNEIQGQVNGNLAKRSPGSTLKPFIYGLAIEQGIIHPKTVLPDAPKRYGAYTPENYDRQFLGPISAEDALIYSRNVPAVNLLAKLKQGSFYNLLKHAEVQKLKSQAHYGLALGLGGAETSMVELVQLYAMLANNGLWQPLRWTRSTPRITARPLISANTAWLTLNMLSKQPSLGNIQAQWVNARERGFPVAWKTGTSWAYRDAWTVGVIGPYVLAVWLGNFDGSSNSALIGRRAAAPLFIELADALYQHASKQDQISYPKDHFSSPPPNRRDLREVEICRGTGALPNKHCPSLDKTWFIAGVSPIQLSKVHRAVPIDVDTGLRRCWHQPPETEQRVYEFWPSDIENLFQQAGFPRAKPPAYADSCKEKTAQQRQRIPPEIKSPDSAISYPFDPRWAEKNYALPFKATADGDSQRLYWFVNNEYVGHSQSNQTLYWLPKIGRHDVKVVDDAGFSRSVALNVEHIVEQ